MGRRGENGCRGGEKEKEGVGEERRRKRALGRREGERGCWGGEKEREGVGEERRGGEKRGKSGR